MRVPTQAELRRRSTERPLRASLQYGVVLAIGTYVFVATTYRGGKAAATVFALLALVMGSGLMFLMIKRRP